MTIWIHPSKPLEFRLRRCILSFMLKKLLLLLQTFIFIFTTAQQPVHGSDVIAEEGRIVVDGAMTTWNKNLYAPTEGCLKFIVTFTNNSQDSRLHYKATVLDRFGMEISSGVNTWYNLAIGATQQRELQICQYQVSNPPFVMRVENYFSDGRRNTFTEAPFKLTNFASTTENTPSVQEPRREKSVIKCTNGKVTKKVKARIPKCPAGYRIK